MPTPFMIPGAPAELMRIINARRATIPNGLVMMAEQEPAGKQENEPPAPGKQEKPPADGGEPLGTPGLAALQKERERADDLDKQVKALQAQFSKLGEALGVDAKSTKAAPDVAALDAINALSLRFEVSELARQHGITDEGDLTVLRSVTDTEARAKLAARLAPAPNNGDGDGKQKGPEKKQPVYPRPKPDASQGPKGEAPKKDPRPGVPRMAEAIEETLAEQ